jgi:hypothetical protein
MVHLLVHLAIQYFMTPEDKASTIRTTAQLLSQVILPNRTFKNWPGYYPHLPHTATFLLHTGEELNTVQITMICFSIGDYLERTGHFHDSKALSERSTMTCCLLIGQEHLKTLKSMLLLANAFE